MEYQYKLRPHHGLCISFFTVKKYNEQYKEYIKKIIAELENASIVCVTLQSDIFCGGGRRGPASVRVRGRRRNPGGAVFTALRHTEVRANCEAGLGRGY